MRRLLRIILPAALLCWLALSAQALSLTMLPDAVRPGQDARIAFISDTAGTARLFLSDTAGQAVYTLEDALIVTSGTNYYTWDGTMQPSGAAFDAGEYVLCIAMNGETDNASLTIGQSAPSVSLLSASTALREGTEWTATVTCNLDGELLLETQVSGIWERVGSADVQAGKNTVRCQLAYGGTPLSAGSYLLRISLRDADGVRSAALRISLSVSASASSAENTETDESKETQEAPASVSDAGEEEAKETASHLVIPSRLTTAEDETCYWTMPLGDLSDEQAIWDIMMQPITVLDVKGRTARETYKVRATPDKSTDADNVVGEVTYKSQGVHVIETLDNGWTKVELYNTSYGSTYRKGSKRGYGVTAELISGYVETEALKTVDPLTEYGLLIDKYTQTMYIFQNGHIIGTLLVSTGKNTSTQPWNETPAGEFLIISRSGGFWSGNMYCDMGLLLNNGCLIHQVPSVVNSETGEHAYASTEAKLGTKASHGCIRVQRVKNENGQNMKWLWDNLRVNTKVLIWEDTGRYTEYPDDDTPIYYNPQGGKRYHSDQNCSSVNQRYLPMTEITYGDLKTEEFSGLTACAKCDPPTHPETIRQKNIENGFDE